MRRTGKGADLGQSLGRVMARLGQKGDGGYLQVKAARAWEAVAGPSVVAHTTGAHLRQGQMVIYVDSPIWATELSALAEEYRTRVNAELGKESVTSVRFSVSRKVQQDAAVQEVLGETDRQRGEDKVESIPLTPEELAQVEASAAQIESADLRDTVIRATVADLEWKKGLAKRNAR